MEKQEKISAARLQLKVGKTIAIIIDEVDDEGAIGRSQADAPEIDGMVYLNDETHHQPGDIVLVVVTHADDHDLWAESA
jgi:ribosomal protein S12 methylthiotransferase